MKFLSHSFHGLRDSFRSTLPKGSISARGKEITSADGSREKSKAGTAAARRQAYFGEILPLLHKHWHIAVMAMPNVCNGRIPAIAWRLYYPRQMASFLVHIVHF